LPLDIDLRPRDSSHVVAVVKIGDKFRFGITERELNFFESSIEPKLFDGFVSSVSASGLSKFDVWFLGCVQIG